MAVGDEAERKDDSYSDPGDSIPSNSGRDIGNQLKFSEKKSPKLGKLGSPVALGEDLGSLSIAAHLGEGAGGTEEESVSS